MGSSGSVTGSTASKVRREESAEPTVSAAGWLKSAPKSSFSTSRVSVSGSQEITPPPNRATAPRFSAEMPPPTAVWSLNRPPFRSVRV